MPELTTTSYAILGLLGIRPWSTYELAKQMAVSLHNFWPRAERKLYEEPKKLVAHGLATTSSEMVGRRKRTVYAITDEGRRALATWLGQPGAMPTLEFEALVKVFFAEQGTKDDLLVALRGIERDAQARRDVDAQWAAHNLATGVTFPGRAGVVGLVGSLQAELNRTLVDWARRAQETVAGWPDDVRAAPLPAAALERIAGAVEAGGPPPPYPR